MLHSAHSKERFALLSLLLAVPWCSAAFASNPTSSNILVHHDRDGWTVTIRGSIPSSRSEVSLTAGGDITVRGGQAKGISYSVSERFRSANEAHVRQAARNLAAAIERQAGGGEWTFPRTSPRITQAVRVELPRSVSRLTVMSVAGNIDVAEIDGSITTRNGAGRTTLDHIGGNAEVRTAGGAITLGLIGGNVHCISGGGAICARTIRGDSFFETSGGEIYAAEVLGAVRAHTGAGSIRIGHAGSSVNATTQGGPIEVVRAEGVVIANNSGGPIQVSSAPGVHCNTASGTIRLSGVSGSVIASTTLGNIIASLFDARLLANSFLQTGGGDITLLIPSNISVTLRATSTGGAGAIVSDFPVRLVTRGAVLEAEGRVNGGGPLLQIAGKGGTIFIRRQ